MGRPPDARVCMYKRFDHRTRVFYARIVYIYICRVCKETASLDLCMVNWCEDGGVNTIMVKVGTVIFPLVANAYGFRSGLFY